MPKLVSPGDPSQMLVSVPVPRPVQSKLKPPTEKPPVSVPKTSVFKKTSNPASLVLPYPGGDDAGDARADYRKVLRRQKNIKPSRFSKAASDIFRREVGKAKGIPVNLSHRISVIGDRLASGSADHELVDRAADYLDLIGQKSGADELRKQIVKPESPEKFTRFRSPLGGMVAQNVFYPGGKMLPKEATEEVPTKMSKDEVDMDMNDRKNPLHGKAFFFTGMSGPPSSKPDRFEAKNDVEDIQGPSDQVHGYGFSSENTGSLKFPEARDNMASVKQVGHVRNIENYLMKEHGIKPHHYSVYNSLGDWGLTPDSMGAEHAAVHVLKQPMNWQDMRKLSARIGLNADQYSVLTFQPHGSADHPAEHGTAMLHRMYIPRGTSMGEIREHLERAGIEFRTVVPAMNGAHVAFVVEPEINPETSKSLDDIAKQIGDGHVDRITGRAEFVGQVGTAEERGIKGLEASKHNYREILGIPHPGGV